MMKKLALVVGLGLVLGSCNFTPADKEGEIRNVDFLIKEVIFKGHLYNVISIYHGGSLSHSPNCKCNQK
jgi:hypothetical protein